MSVPFYKGCKKNTKSLRSPKVVILSNIIWNISNFRIDLIKDLINQSYEVVCIADEDEFSDSSIASIKESGAVFRRIKISRKGTNPLNDIVYMYKLYHILKFEKADLIILYTIKPVIYGSLIAGFLRIPSISVITGTGYVFMKKNILYNIVKLLYKISLRYNSQVLFLNSDDRDQFVTEKMLDPAKACILSGEGINTETFRPLSHRSNDGRIIFLMLSRLLWDKGVGEYVEAAKIIGKKYPNAEFRLLGFLDSGNPSAISEEQLYQWVKKGYINYLGTTDNVKEVIDKVDCVVLPSSYREGVPRSLMEAAAMCKAIITTDNTGCRDIVDDTINGFLCKVRDAVNLSEKMEQFIALHYEERIAMGNKGREKVVRQYDVKNVNKIYMNIIENDVPSMVGS